MLPFLHKTCSLTSSNPIKADKKLWFIRLSELQQNGANTCTNTSLKSPAGVLKKVSSYIAQYPILRISQSALHFTSHSDIFNQTPSQLLWEASSHMLQLMCKGCLYTHPPLSIARYSFIQLSELEQCRVKKLAEGFNTTAQVSNSSRVWSSTPEPLRSDDWHSWAHLIKLNHPNQVCQTIHFMCLFCHSHKS